MLEEWAYCVSAPLYDISSHGHVVRRDTDELVSPWIGKEDHLYVTVELEETRWTRDREWKTVYREEIFPVWVLLIKSWTLGWDYYEFDVCYLDRDSTNCSIENIRAWYINPRTGEKRIVGYKFDGERYIFDKRKRGRVEVVETGEVFDGTQAAAKAVGGTKSGVSLVLNGRLETHRGLRFRYID